MQLSNGVLYLETSQTGARINTLQLGSKHFFYPQQYIDKDDGIVLRGGMHICSPIFGSPEGKGIFSRAPQHGELRDFIWEGHATSETNPTGICYSYHYIKWGGVNLEYFVSYFLDENRLTTYTDIRNQGSMPINVELGWHPYFNSPDGGKLVFPKKKKTVIPLNGAYGPEIFPASDKIAIELWGIGKVILLLEDGHKNGYVCVWTDWRRNYFCVEPLLTYKDYSQGVKLASGKNILAKFTMIFDD